MTADQVQCLLKIVLQQRSADLCFPSQFSFGSVCFKNLSSSLTWVFKTGETAGHTFVTVHEIRDGLVYRWTDYWDMNKFISQFPGWFLEEMARHSADEFTD